MSKTTQGTMAWRELKDKMFKERIWMKKEVLCEIEQSHNNKKMLVLSEPSFNPGTRGLWAHHASVAPLW